MLMFLQKINKERDIPLHGARQKSVFDPFYYFRILKIYNYFLMPMEQTDTNGFCKIAQALGVFVFIICVPKIYGHCGHS